MGYTQLTLDPNNFIITSELQSDQLQIQNIENIIDTGTANTNIIDGSDGGLQNNGAITIRHTFDAPQFLNKVILDIGDDNYSLSTGSLHVSQNGTSYSQTAFISTINNNENEFNCSCP